MGDPSAHAKSQQHHNDATQDELIATEHDRIILFGIFFHQTGGHCIGQGAQEQASISHEA